jgi:hypothetical protein
LAAFSTPAPGHELVAGLAHWLVSKNLNIDPSNTVIIQKTSEKDPKEPLISVRYSLLRTLTLGKDNHQEAQKNSKQRLGDHSHPI